MEPTLIIGAGLTGCTIARLLADAGKDVLIIDRRDHLAGNAYDFKNEHGIVQHAYGPHIFHTSNQAVVDFLSRFTEWIPYEHKAKAMLSDGRLVTLPVNRETAEIVGRDNIIETFYRPYSEKMWGMPLEQISPEILNRVKVREDDNELYFPDDTFQKMPAEGYTRMVERMVESERIEVRLSTSDAEVDFAEFKHVFYSGPIDVYFDFRFGPLPYRSIRFKTVHVPAPRLFPTAIVNFTHTGPHTRVSEWKNFPEHGDHPELTTLTFETPCDYKENNDERYYPVKDAEGVYREQYKRYQALAEEECPHITFCGRLGNYAYLDMHQAINSAMKLAEKHLAHGA